MTANTCAHHRDRPAHALCMSCHKGLCQECATPWDGIHYCTSCLAEKRRAVVARPSWIAILPVAVAAAGLFWAVARVTVRSALNALDLWQ
jgi:hypothetical protein